MVVRGKPIFKRFSFALEVDGLGEAHFTSAGPLEVMLNRSSFRQAGSSIPIKKPDSVEFADITLERGLTSDIGLFQWFKDSSIAIQEAGISDVGFYRNVGLLQSDRDGSTMARWTINKAFPIKFRAGAWDANAEENVIESVTLSVGYWELTRLLSRLNG